MFKRLLSKVEQWQKWLVIVVSLITSITFLYPRVQHVIKETKQIIAFQKQSRQIVDDIDDLKGYIQVLSGILRSALTKLDDNNYGTVIIVKDELSGKLEKRLVEVKLRKTQTGDIFVFVPDNDIGVYSVSFNIDEGKYSYIDFTGEYHLIYEVDIASTIDK